MDWMAEMKAFGRWLETGHLSGAAQLLWFKMTILNNSCMWDEWFAVDNLRLMVMVNAATAKPAIRARDELLEAGLLEYRKGKKGSPNRYHLISIAKKYSAVYTPVSDTVTDTITDTESEKQCLKDTEKDTVTDTESEKQCLKDTEKDTKNDTISDTETGTTKGTHNKTYTYTQDIDKENESIGAAAPLRPVKRKRGKYGWVKLTDEEYEGLKKEFGREVAEHYIGYVDESAQQTGNKNKWKDWNLTVRKAVRGQWGGPPPGQGGKQNESACKSAGETGGLFGTYL